MLLDVTVSAPLCRGGGVGAAISLLSDLVRHTNGHDNYLGLNAICSLPTVEQPASTGMLVESQAAPIGVYAGVCSDKIL